MLINFENKNIIEIGPGTGALTDHIINKNSKLDIEEKMIILGRKLFQEMNIAKDKYLMTVSDAFKFLENLKEGSFETVLCLGMLYYTTEPYRLLKLMLRALRCLSL